MCGMNEVACTNIRKEIKTLAEVQNSGVTGFQETFQVKLEIHFNIPNSLNRNQLQMGKKGRYMSEIK